MIDQQDNDNIPTQQPEPCKPYTVKCLTCNKPSEWDIADIAFECSSTDSRPQGLRLFYEALHEIDCEHCGEPNSVCFEYTEYPEGVIEYDEGGTGAVTHVTEGADLIADPFNPVILEYGATIEELFR